MAYGTSTHRTARMAVNRAYGVILSGDITSNGASNIYTLHTRVRSVTILINVTGVGGTSPAITFTYYAYDPVQKISFPVASIGAITATGVYYIQVIDPPTPYFQVGWTVSGTNPVFKVTISFYAW